MPWKLFFGLLYGPNLQVAAHKLPVHPSWNFFFPSLIIGLEYDQPYTSSNSRRTIGVEFSRKRINEAVDDNDFTNILVVGRIIGPKMPDFGSQKFDKKFFSYSWVYLF